MVRQILIVVGTCVSFAALGPMTVIKAGEADAAKKPAKELLGMPLVFFDDFESGADRWEQSDSRAWKVIDLEGNHAYSQFQKSEVVTPVRSPFNRALVKEVIVGDFVLDVQLGF